MNLISRINLNYSIYFSLLFALIPISFIAGNMIININILLLILSSIFVYQKKIFQIKYYLLDKILLTFFLFVIFTGLYNDIKIYLDDFSKWIGYFRTIIKSILFLKYLLLYFVLRYLIENNIIKFKYFFLFSTFGTIFVSLDIFYQLITGRDIFGYESIALGRKLGGPFGDELIAGGYIQRFCLFSFFLLPIFYNYKSKKILVILFSLLFIVFFSAITFSGNRMPLILFLFTIFLISLFQKQARNLLIPCLIVFSILFSAIYTFNSKVNYNFIVFYGQIKEMALTIKQKDLKLETAPQYLKEFSTFYDTWLMNKYAGGGIKNFRYYCHKRPNIKKDFSLSSKFKMVCNMHPHNYYLEILTETGIIGFLIIISFFLIVFYKTLVKKYFLRSNLYYNHIITPFIFLFIVEIFPIKSTGSFFTTGNTTYLFLIIGTLIGLTQRDISIEKKS